MDWVTGIQNAVDYIEAHITDELDYGEAAKQAESLSADEAAQEDLQVC